MIDERECVWGANRDDGRQTRIGVTPFCMYMSERLDNCIDIVVTRFRWGPRTRPFETKNDALREILRRSAL